MPRLREIGQDELHRAGRKEPTIDHVEVKEFDSREEMMAWLEECASAIVRR